MDIRVAYDAPKTMGRFLGSDAFVRVVVGPIGSGKSSGCVLEIPRRAAEQAPGPDGIRRTRFAVVRNTYRELKDTTRKTFEQWVPAQLGKWNEQDFVFRMRFGDVESEVLFRALDRSEDVKKLLSLELTGCYFNELRQISKIIFDGMTGRVGRYPSKKDGGATWHGVWGDSNPWHTGHWAHKLFKSQPKGFSIFRQPGGRSTEAENVANLPNGYYETLCNGKDTEWIRVYVDGEEATSDVGSVFGAQVDGLEKRGGICDFEHPMDEVFTSWDLGMADATAIWFWRIGSNGLPEVLDFYAGHGRPLSHYLDVIETKGFSYAKHWLPHDARAKTLATGTSVLEQLADRVGAGAVAIGPQLSLADGLQAARWLLEQPMRFHSRCTQPVFNDAGGEENPGGIESLREYRYEWDEEDRVFSRRPLHNWASHPADAFRYLACVAKHSELVMRKPVVERPSLAVPIHRSVNLDQLWEANERGRGRERI